jgi:5-methylcytosine-specific restriction endonuclease McrA
VIKPLPKPEKRGKKPPKPLKRSKIKVKFYDDETWIKIRQLYFDQHPPDYDDQYYQCGLCPFAVHKDEVVLDHKIPKSSHPELKYDFDNLHTAHFTCNSLKGSMTLEAYNRKYYKEINNGKTSLA